MIVNRAIYLGNGSQPDPAITKSLSDNGFGIEHTHTIVETLQAIYDHQEAHRSAGGSRDAGLLIVAEVQSGGIPLLIVLREELRVAPPVLLFDRSIDNVRVAVQALQLGADEYLLHTDDAEFRRERTLMLLERMRETAEVGQDGAHWAIDDAALRLDGVDWDPMSNRIVVDDVEVHLTPIQARIFDRLWVNRNATVSTADLVRLVLLRDDIDLREGSRLLRPHLVRLRNALDNHPKLAHRIVNIRGSGYMLI
jgi:DNA-binding response OmpR family regulator